MTPKRSCGRCWRPALHWRSSIIAGAFNPPQSRMFWQVRATKTACWCWRDSLVFAVRLGRSVGEYGIIHRRQGLAVWLGAKAGSLSGARLFQSVTQSGIAVQAADALGDGLGVVG